MPPAARVLGNRAFEVSTGLVLEGVLASMVSWLLETSLTSILNLLRPPAPLLFGDGDL